MGGAEVTTEGGDGALAGSRGLAVGEARPAPGALFTTSSMSSRDGSSILMNFTPIPEGRPSPTWAGSRFHTTRPTPAMSGLSSEMRSSNLSNVPGPNGVVVLTKIPPRLVVRVVLDELRRRSRSCSAPRCSYLVRVCLCACLGSSYGHRTASFAAAKRIWVLPSGRGAWYRAFQLTDGSCALSLSSSPAQDGASFRHGHRRVEGADRAGASAKSGPRRGLPRDRGPSAHRSRPGRGLRHALHVGPATTARPRSMGPARRLSGGDRPPVPLRLPVALAALFDFLEQSRFAG